MLDINLIREDPERVKQAMRDLNDEEAIPRIDLILELDERRRALLQEVEAMRAERNKTSKIIGRTRDPAERQTKIDQMKKLSARLEKLEAELREVEAALNEEMLWIPNLPAEDVPVGPDESHNVVVRQEGDLPEFDFEPLPHWDLGPMLDIIDFERGVKLSGSRFYVLKGAGARLQRALITWMLDVHIQQHGYTEVYPPFMVRGYCLVGTGNLPKFGDNLYRDIEEDYWFIPTAEVPVTNLHRDEILDGDDLPLYYVAYTPCFRREKMSAGRDVRGIKRGHQFDKVEMVKFVEGDPEVSERELQSLVDNAEDIARLLKIPHRVVQMCTGDLSFVAAKKYDVEMWAAGSQEWLEVSSCSNFRDFQARRANIRYRPAKGEKPRYVHTLNGSGLALPRVMIAILENYQQPDGSVVIPEVLRPYMGGIEVIEPPARA
ncbi:MAG TPA: serine--tRNA ligase [Chloroflexi bacterium]|nr:serine--tRNA ligase [Chloroflexota bacterium]